MAIACLLLFAAAQLAPNAEWEQTPGEERVPGVYHPMLRFNPASTFVFKTPDFIAEGHYTQDGSEYYLQPETAEQLNHADMDKLVADLDPDTRRKVQDAYSRSLRSFRASYNSAENVLVLTYPAAELGARYVLHMYTDGDPPGPGDPASGLWNAPEPYPDRMDSKWRYRIGGLEGLQQFSKEGGASDAAQFGLLDLRTNHTYRNHEEENSWVRNGATVKLTRKVGTIVLTLSPNGRKLLMGGKVAYER